MAHMKIEVLSAYLNYCTRNILYTGKEMQFLDKFYCRVSAWFFVYLSFFSQQTQNIPIAINKGTS